MTKNKNYTPGDLIRPYRLLKKIGGGGNGDVWTVEYISGVTGQYALKILRSKFHSNKLRYDRFRKEAIIQKKLTDSGEEGILPVLDFNLPERPGKLDPPWIRTPIATPSVSDKNGNYDVRDGGLAVISILVSQIANALTSIELKGVFHRDIKPDNIFLYNGQWVLGDFGLVTTIEVSNLTEQNEVVGPAAFIAPEMRYRASEAKPGPADVYSLGKMFWYLSSKFREINNVPGGSLSTQTPEQPFPKPSRGAL